MATTTNLGLHYPAPTDPPDGSGGIYALALDLDTILGGGTWFPTLGGGNGATVGSSPAASGRYFTVGKHSFARGYIAFGSSASFGTGTATISGLPVSIDQYLSGGEGYFQNGNNLWPVKFTPLDGANIAIRPVVSAAAGALATLGIASALGTPPQSSVLRFTLDLVSA